MQGNSIKPMTHITLPTDEARPLSFYLAMEEYVARYMTVPDCFMMWQVKPSVIFGRNQLIENEVNLNFCRSHDISIYRRKSGGGCVYADMSNIMFSYITSEEQVGFTFNRYIMVIVNMLHRLGVDASASGRNDVMIGDRKVSGNAFYKIPGRSIVHGTMLYDTNLINMVGSITPSGTKLLSKGILSVRQRIALLKDYTDLSLDEFKAFALKTICDEEQVLTEKDIKCIKEIEKEYDSDAFIFGKNPRYTLVKQRRIEGVGELEVRLELKNGIIKDVNLMGDYFPIGDVDGQLLQKLRGVPLEHCALSRALPYRIDDVIRNLVKEDFISLLIE